MEKLVEGKLDLDDLIYVPGHFKCAKCSCYLVTSVMKEPRQCGNNCGPMWRVTWKDHAKILAEELRKLNQESRARWALGTGVV